MEASKRVCRLADCSTSLRKGVAPMMNCVTYSDLFAFALVVIGIVALLKSKGR